MKRRPQQYLPVLGALLFLLLLFGWGNGIRRGSAPPRLAVGLVAVENNPGHPRARAPTVLNGITGLCAIFALTNISKDASIWFDTSAVEQRVGSEWRRIPVPPYESRERIHLQGGKPWWAIASNSTGTKFSPGTSCHFVVAWPPDLPTNASWRLELCCGPEPSANARKWDAMLGFRWFTRRTKGQTVYTPEVRQ
jgi:hypothetical protein